MPAVTVSTFGMMSKSTEAKKAGLLRFADRVLIEGRWSGLTPGLTTVAPGRRADVG